MLFCGGLSGQEKHLLFNSTKICCLTQMLQDEERTKKTRRHVLGGNFSDLSNLEATYPLVHEKNGRILRYSFTPADAAAKGLVVLFHGWGGEFSSGLRPKGWEEYDLLAPWDTYGHNRRDSWFWGEKGDNFVEQLVQDLIRNYREKKPNLPWFCSGQSMGGFGALYHGIKFHADGLYVQMPQVDLRLKIKEYGKDNVDNPYGYLQGTETHILPDLLGTADEQDFLPPLFLIQNQFDAVNPFAKHGGKLIEIYNRKKNWYGLRIYPAIGHSHDGSPEEASYFFLKL